MINYEHSLSYMNDSTDKKLFINVDGSGFSVITNKNIHNGQFTLEESICSESELRFGGCESSKIQFKMNNVTGSLKDRLLTVKHIVDGDNDNHLQLGVFKVFSDKLTSDRRHKEIVAYDRMYDIVNTDITEFYNGIIFPISIKELRNLLFEKLEVNQEEIELVNDDLIVNKSEYSSKVYAGDLLKDICEINGCFGKIGRDDSFHYVSLGENVVETKQKKDYSDAQYEDFKTSNITQLIISQSSSDYYYGEIGNAYNLSMRILEVDEKNLQELCDNLFGKIKDITYVPTTIDCRGNPCLECGDKISFISGENVEVTTYILERKLTGISALRDNYMSDGTEYYEDINTMSDKSITQLKQGIAEVSKNGFYSITMTNSEIHNVSGNEQTVLKYNTATTMDTDIIVFATIPFYADMDGVVVLRYYRDAELMENQQVRMYFHKGYDVLSVCNYLSMKQNDRINLSITLQVEYFESEERKNSQKIIAIEDYIKNGGSYDQESIDETVATISIQKEAIRSVLIGKGLIIATGWDGTINLSDSFSTFDLDNIPVVGFEDSVSISKLTPNRSEISESFGFITSSMSIVGISDNMIVNEVVDNYTFSTEKASFYDYDTDRVTIDGVFTLNTAYSDPQTVTSNAISIEHSSILGIESATATCTGTLSMAISTDDKVTWKAHNGTEWLTLSDDYSGMSKEQLEAITVDQWNEIIQDVDAIYIRIALTDTTQSVEEIIINFAN